jgi:hypothetical protein
METSKAKEFIMAPWEKLKDSWVEYSHALYVLLVIFGLYFHDIQSATEFKSRAVLIALLIYFVVLLLFLGYFIHIYARKARYAEAMSYIHDAIHDLRNATAYLKKCRANKATYEESKAKNELQQTLDAVATAFSMVTGTKCRSAIKILGGVSRDGLFVKTLCRDTISTNRSKQKDETEGEKHLVSQNTDYNSLVNKLHNYYLNNDINAKGTSYINTSKTTPTDVLSYSSAIVLPIRLYSSAGSGGKPTFNIIGFLTVDSSSRKTFTEKFDVQMGAIVADALYPAIDLLSKVHRNSHQCSIAEEIEAKCL